MEQAIIVELVRVFLTSAFTLAELGKLSAEEKDKLVAETAAGVRSRLPSELPEVPE